MAEKPAFLPKRGKRKLLAHQGRSPANASGEAHLHLFLVKCGGKWSAYLVPPLLCDPGRVAQPLWSESSGQQAAAHPAPQGQTRNRFLFLGEGGEAGVKPRPTGRPPADLLLTQASCPCSVKHVASWAWARGPLEGHQPLLQTSLPSPLVAAGFL